MSATQQQQQQQQQATHTANATKVIILGAAGRDFHNFNTVYRDDPTHKVVAFTAAQIPDIAGRMYPPSLSGPLYPAGIPIASEEDLEALVAEHGVDVAVLAYSDLSYGTVGSISARVHATGADFALLGPKATQIASTVPVVSVCAVRTGCGKSQTTRYVATLLKEKQGLKVVTIRHPMPYGDLAKQAVQRFATREDLDAAECTFEEREEYEKYVDMGLIIYAGVDYGAILESAQAEADVILWDGGNNDWSFYVSDLLVCVADPLRPGHESAYFPGEVNFRAADIILINKVDSAEPDAVLAVCDAAAKLNPSATVLKAQSALSLTPSEAVRDKRVLAVDDGPTLTHGGMDKGAGSVAAGRFGAAELVDPRPFAVGSIKDTLDAFPHLTNVLPAMGYFAKQVEELEATIAASDAQVVVIGTPFDLASKLDIAQPIATVTYELDLGDDAAAFDAAILAAVSGK